LGSRNGDNTTERTAPGIMRRSSRSGEGVRCCSVDRKPFAADERPTGRDIRVDRPC